MSPLFGVTHVLNSAELPASHTSVPDAGRERGDVTSSAREFESILLGQWLQGAESSFGGVPGSDGQDAGDEQMMSFGIQTLAKAFTAAGGIGLATMVEAALKQAGESRSPERFPVQPAAVPALD